MMLLLAAIVTANTRILLRMRRATTVAQGVDSVIATALSAAAGIELLHRHHDFYGVPGRLYSDICKALHE